MGRVPGKFRERNDKKMRCPLCGARTGVRETRGPYRDRRCTNAACHLEFTTREEILIRREDTRLCARTRAAHSHQQARKPATDQVIAVGQTNRVIG